MSPARLADRLGKIVQNLDIVAVWVGGDDQASAELALAASELHEIKLEIERQTFAQAVSA